MTLPEAIKINKDVRAVHLLHGEMFAADAIQLGIEAMKRDLHNRRVDNHPDQALLPGETED